MHLQTARWLCYFHRPQKAMTFHRPHTVSKVDTIRKLYRFVFAYLQYHRTFSENQKQQLAQCSVSYIIPSPIHITLPKKKHGPRGLKGIETYWNHMIISKTSTSPRLPAISSSRGAREKRCSARCSISSSRSWPNFAGTSARRTGALQETTWKSIRFPWFPLKMIYKWWMFMDVH